VLVLVAHADDESVAYGALLLRMREAVVVIATDGVPRDEYFWGPFGSRENYRALRRDEARRAAQLAGVHKFVLLADEDSRLEDQRLFLNLAPAYQRLEKLAEWVRPESIATLAYEGGHPDHDSCSLLGARLGQRFGVPVWEAPLYHWGYHRQGNGEVCGEGRLRVQEFVWKTGCEAELEVGAAELERKRSMCEQYASQGDFLRTFDVRRELVRPQVNYDYKIPPHEGQTNYEHWQWWMSAREVSAKFQEFLETSVE
jgi:LmbE family N-acetylglucosaminyl deacetylase